MNRIENLFQTKQQNILSIYYPAGYPNLQDTVPILHELEQAGVDMVEIGIPFPIRWRTDRLSKMPRHVR